MDAGSFMLKACYLRKAWPPLRLVVPGRAPWSGPVWNSGGFKVSDR